ncbi:MAG: hypothetical protein IKD55_05225 [Sediminibacterium sp.]|nr:hypothetical protein [Sediminibacterium sp.]MBX9780016.1 hypothetical protein [Chitinophagaceae bacterium]
MKQFNFLSTKTWGFILALSGMLIMAACKKDAFNEKDALTAQQSLLQVKFNYELTLKNIDLQIQRVSDSAKLAMINLQFRSDSALERVKQSSAIAQLLQKYQNDRLLALQADSLSKGIANLNDAIAKAKKLWDDSVALAANSTSALNSLRKNYSLAITDITTSTPIAGATVSVIPYNASAAITATTNANGIATFNGQIIDPAAFFSVSATGYSSILIREASLVNIGSVPSTTTPGSTTTVRGVTTSVGMFNTANTRNTIRGSVMGDLDLTNGDSMEAVVGHLVTFTTTISTGLPPISVVYQFPAVSDANGNYTVSVPDGTFTPVYANNTKVQQRLYVNSFTDEDASTTVPRIATIGATISSAGTNLSAGNGTGIYYTLPADTITGRTVIAAVTPSTGTNLNNFILPTFGGGGINFSNRNLGSVRTDSLGNNFTPLGSASSGTGSTSPFVGASNLTLNNATGVHSTDNSVGYRRNLLYTTPNNSGRPDTISPVTLVSLVPGWIVSAPSLRATINGNTGKIQGITLALTNIATGNIPTWQVTPGAGGIFNNAVMFTTGGRPVYTNLQGLPGTYLPSLATNVTFANNNSNFSITGGNSYYLPIEFRNTIQRDRIPR